MVRFEATARQVQEMAAAAVNNSIPTVFAQSGEDYRPTLFTADDFEVPIDLDLVLGRMTKLEISAGNDDGTIWKSFSFPPLNQYQTWGRYFPGTSLIEKHGGKLL